MSGRIDVASASGPTRSRDRPLGTKILVLLGPLDVNGGNIFMLDLVGALHAGDRDVTVLSGRGPLLHRLERPGLNIRDFDLAGGFLRDLPRLGALRRAALEVSPDFILVAHPHMARTGALLARSVKRPWALFVPEKLPSLGMEGRPRPASVLVPSRAALDGLVLRGGSPERFQVLPVGVDLGRYAAPVPVARTERVVVGSLARFDDVEGLFDLLKATQLLLSRDAPVHLIIAGSGHGDARPRRLARDFGIQQHVTVTELSGDFEPFLDVMDICVLPHTSEWLGAEILQAAAAGRALVATAVGATFALVKADRTGLLVPPGDPESLSRAVATLVEAPERASELAAAARSAAERGYGIERSARRLMQLITAASHRRLEHV